MTRDEIYDCAPLLAPEYIYLVIAAHWPRILTLSVVSVYVLPVVTSSPYRSIDSNSVLDTREVVRRSGTLFLWPFVIRRATLTHLDNY